LQHRSGAEFKLFDEMRDRPDVQPLSFNIDRKIGEVATFLRQQGYTFPVLLASSCVDKLLGEGGILQNWIVDAEGKWLWEQIGFDSRGVQTARERSGENGSLQEHRSKSGSPIRSLERAPAFVNFL